MEKFFKFVCLLFILAQFTACKTARYPVHQHKYQKAKIDQIVNSSYEYLGTPYLFGGMSKSGLDCSGLLYLVFKENGYTLPRNSGEQAKLGKQIDLLQVQKGDLLFFGTSNSGINHVGLVSAIEEQKGVKFIHASTSKGVREDYISTAYWQKAFIKATRPFEN